MTIKEIEYLKSGSYVSKVSHPLKTLSFLIPLCQSFPYIH